MKHVVIICMFVTGFSINILQAQKVTGKIYVAQQNEVIGAASILNKNLQQFNLADQNGHYSINAREGDTLIFSAIGFLPDTQLVQYYMLDALFDVALKQQVSILPLVKVKSNYQLDSLLRRNEYQDVFNMPGITGGNRPTNGFGISLSPVSYFSRAARQKRELKKKIIKQEQEYFIDYCFPQQWVKQLTGLDDRSLKLFMYSYRPTYQFCRKTDRAGMLTYINEKLIEFKQRR